MNVLKLILFSILVYLLVCLIWLKMMLAHRTVFLKRGFMNGTGHWTTTRALPDGFQLQNQYRIYKSKPNFDSLTLRQLFECKRADSHTNFVSLDPKCENEVFLDVSGLLFINESSNTVPIYRCRTENDDHFISTCSNCENATTEFLIGYILI